MEYIGYLLSIKELIEGPNAEELVKQACGKLDAERLLKVNACEIGKKRAQCIGAGLLLQMGLQHGMQEMKTAVEAEQTSDLFGNPQIKRLTVAEVLDKLGEPVEVKYSYGKQGKPAFRAIPLCFNVSHSEEYVFCAFSEREIGADIQCCKSENDKRMDGIMKRFFTEAEYAKWKGLSDADTQREFFYLLWTRKESYGKLTGEGIVSAIGIDIESQAEAPIRNVTWQDFMCFGDDAEKTTYFLSICTRKESQPR